MKLNLKPLLTVHWVEIKDLINQKISHTPWHVETSHMPRD